jgi:hypothetical protein
MQYHVCQGDAIKKWLLAWHPIAKVHLCIRSLTINAKWYIGRQYFWNCIMFDTWLSIWYSMAQWVPKCKLLPINACENQTYVGIKFIFLCLNNIHYASLFNIAHFSCIFTDTQFAETGHLAVAWLGNTWLSRNEAMKKVLLSSAVLVPSS